MAVYGDETSYPGMIYPWLDTLRLLNGLAHPDALRHAGFGGGGRRSAIKPRTCANRARDTAISASWNVTYRPWRTTLAPILTSFCRSIVNDQRSASSGGAHVACGSFLPVYRGSQQRPEVGVKRTFPREGPVLGAFRTCIGHGRNGEF